MTCPRYGCPEPLARTRGASAPPLSAQAVSTHTALGACAGLNCAGACSVPNTSGHSRHARTGGAPAASSNCSMHPRKTTSSHNGPTTNARSFSSGDGPALEDSSARIAKPHATGVARSAQCHCPAVYIGAAAHQRRRYAAEVTSGPRNSAAVRSSGRNLPRDQTHWIMKPLTLSIITDLIAASKG